MIIKIFFLFNIDHHNQLCWALFYSHARNDFYRCTFLWRRQRRQYYRTHIYSDFYFNKNSQEIEIPYLSSSQENSLFSFLLLFIYYCLSIQFFHFILSLLLWFNWKYAVSVLVLFCFSSFTRTISQWFISHSNKIAKTTTHNRLFYILIEIFNFFFLPSHCYMFFSVLLHSQFYSGVL